MIFLLLLPAISRAETYYLKLRASYHPGFLRIVLEGPESVIKRGIVNQKAQSVLVTFPDTDFTINAEKGVIVYRKTDDNAVMFFPGAFRGLKVFTLKYPARLVIDVYKDVSRGNILSPVSPPVKRPEEKPDDALRKVRTVVIDPGHGGYESGMVKDNYREKNVVLDIAKKLRVLINRGSSRGFLTRGSDRFMTQGERVKFANNRNADIFISLHIGDHSGIVIYVPVITGHVPDAVKPYLVNKGQEAYMKRTVALLNAMKEAVMSRFGADSVSVRPLPYSILSRIEAAALMIELPSFEDAYYIEELKTEMADTLYKGLYIYEEIGTR
ncbi:MAG: N-acetylmuramoyl-L-alanine amidase [Deferribacteres bacterium]|nr:N-acetylmuramoyl-L-alanine amidase [Deferribacteres bacterium]